MSKKKNTEVVDTYYRIKMDDGWYGLDGEQQGNALPTLCEREEQ